MRVLPARAHLETQGRLSDVYTAFCELCYGTEMTVCHPKAVEIIHKLLCMILEI